jgi:hypothetical protein
MNDVAIPQAQQAALDKHAAAIRECAERIRKRSLDELVEIGRHLAEVKKILGHGNFLPWLKHEFDWSEDTAERYIALHALKQQIPHEQNLGLTVTALAALGRSTTPPGAVDAVVEKVRAGDRPTVSEVRATIREARMKRPRLPSYVPTRNAEPITPPATAVHSLSRDIGERAAEKESAIVALAHKHRAAIVDLMRKMTQPERISFRQAMIASMTDAMMELPGGE